MIRTSVHVIPQPRFGVGRFARWIAESCEPGGPVLNIGAGKNLSGALRPVLRRSPYLVGVDPDSSLEANLSLAESHQMSLEQFAPANQDRFDVAFSVYVLEHVADAAGFTNACGRVLKPGGSLYGLTLNMHQYFGAITWASTRLGIADWMLEKLKGREVIDEYHFATQYRLNTVRTLTKRLDAASFRSVEFRCFEETGRYAAYLPSPAKGFADVYTKAAYALGRPGLMGHLSFRAQL